MPYSDNLDNEHKPTRKKLLPQGWRIFQILKGVATTSKAGNPMFVFTIKDNETDYVDNIYCILTPGKRWMLKCILLACGITKNSDGNYNWDFPNLLHKDICGLVEHEPGEYINRLGETVKITQHHLIDFKKFEPTNINGMPVGNPGGISDPKDIAWEN